MPNPTLYHRLVGWHAPALRRAVLLIVVGTAVGLALGRVTRWQLAAIGGWDATCVAFLAVLWPMILRADRHVTHQHARREDDTRGTAALLLLAASVMSLLGVVVALPLAGEAHGTRRGVLIAVAGLTVLLSWAVLNTVFLLRYADQQSAPGSAGIDFGPADDQPTYRDFAYVAFTIGMTYQVSDTMIRDPRIRRTVIVHGLLAYLFGVVIVAGAINIVAGLIR